jgi:hypothetical protein
MQRPNGLWSAKAAGNPFLPQLSPKQSSKMSLFHTGGERKRTEKEGAPSGIGNFCSPLQNFGLFCSVGTNIEKRARIAFGCFLFLLKFVGFWEFPARIWIVCGVSG